MQTVGIRELKAKLSEYLRRARKGEVVLVTDRGRVVAEIRSATGRPGTDDELAGLRVLIDQGLVREGTPTDPSAYRPSPLRAPDGTARRDIDLDREDR
jgi:prevent-host-death family protein